MAILQDPADTVFGRSRLWPDVPHSGFATWTPFAITIFATCYFGVLALINAHAVPMSYALVAGTEALILLAVIAIVGQTSILREDALPVALLFVFVVLAVLVSLINDRVFPDALRNLAIVGLFTMLGLRTRPGALDLTYLVLSILILFFLVVEIASVDLYVAIFKPAAFFQNFRGFEAKEWDETGLFGNALGFQSRWTFGLSTHRTASIFTEQVSLANFAGVMTVMLVTRWSELSTGHRVLHVVTLLAILLTNSSRTSTGIAVLSVAAYRLYPHLPRYGALLIGPTVLASGFLLVGLKGLSESDDLMGRISITVRTLTQADLPFWLGGEVSRAAALYDTGYGYAVASSSILGLIAVWLYVSMVIPQITITQKRCAYALGIYVFGNMMIGGNAIYAMKVAAPLWLLVGFVARLPEKAR